jgi:hypothetical protein
MGIEPKPKEPNEKHQVTIEDVNRVLEVGCLLFSLVTEEESEALTELLATREGIGNTSVS